MKKLLLPALLVPSVAMAGMVLVDDGSTGPQTPGMTQPPVASMAPNVASGGVSAPAVAVPVPDAGIVPVWSASKGSTLRDSIQKWADQAKWTLVWDAPDGPDKTVNYPIVAPLHFQGSIDQAVGDCIRLYEHAKKPLGVEINQGQRLLYVHLKYS